MLSMLNTYQSIKWGLSVSFIITHIINVRVGFTRRLQQTKSCVKNTSNLIVHFYTIYIKWDNYTTSNNSSHNVVNNFNTE